MSENELRNKKLSMDRYEYNLFLIEKAIELRKHDINVKKLNKLVSYDEEFNIVVIGNKNDPKLKIIEDINKKIYLGNFLDSEGYFFRILEEFITGKAIFLKGLLEYTLRMDKSLLIYEKLIRNLLKISPSIYYNSHYNILSLYSTFDNFFKERNIILGSLDLSGLEANENNNSTYKELFFDFMDFFGANYLIRKGNKYFFKEISFKNKKKEIISLGNKNLLIDTGFKMI